MSGKKLPLEQILQAALKEKPTEGKEPLPDLGIDLVEHRVQALEQSLRESIDTHVLRLEYAGRIFWLICAWLICVVISIFLSGFNGYGFSLSDTVLVAFITSTTVSVLGLFIIVAKWMFPSSNKR